MANLNNSDLLVVGRGASTYKATFKELSDSLPDPSLPDATEAVKGVAEVATQAETNAGADDTRMVTPLKLKEYVTEQLKATWLPAPFNMGSVGGSTWNGPADTVTATGDVEVKIGNGAWGTGGPVTTSTQLQARFKPASIDAAPHGSTLTGSIQNAAGSVSQQYTGTIDKLPGAITITPAADVAASAVSESAASTAVSGINAPVRLWLDSTDGTNAEVSIAGGAWTAVPATAAAGLAITAGATFKLRHTTQAGASTVTTTTVRVGWDAASSVTVAYATTNAASKAPDVGAVTLSDSTAGANRFTSEVFPVSATMTDDGTPTSSKALKAWVEGALQRQPVSSAITQVAADTPSVGQTTLTFTDNTDLANFASGDAVTELGGGDDATGTVGSVDTVANTITLSASAGTWDVGSQVVGPVKTITFTPESDEIVGVAADTPAAGQTTLTLASDKDLAEFAAGDAVNQDSVPASAAIPLTRIDWNVPTGGSWNIYEIRINNQVVTNPALITLNQPDADNLTDGDESTFVQMGKNSTLSVDISSYSPVSSISIKDYGDGPSWQAFSPNGKGQWLAFNGGTEVALNAVDVDSYEFHERLNELPTGTVGSVDVAGPTITLSSSTGTWSANTGNFVVGPPKPSQSTRLYCEIDGAGNVSDLQSADPGFTAWTPSGAGPYTGNVTFPATFPTGKAPDADLPAGTTLTVEVQASNTAGSDSAKSNTITPA